MRFHACGLIAFPQLIEEVLELGRYARRIRAKHLLKPLAHRIANRLAGFVIEHFDLLCM